MPSPIVLGSALAFVLVAAWVWSRSTVVLDYQAGVLRRSGRFVRELGAGRHWRFLPGSVIELVDCRWSLIEVRGQEIPTRDRASVKVSAVARHRVVAARAWLEGSTTPIAELHATLQIALRAAVAKLDVETVLTDHTAVDAEVLAAVHAVAGRLGLEIDSVALKDVAAAGDQKRALADEAKARAEGRAKLERARAETAALRNLVNASRLVRENIGLYELRLLETAAHAADRPGNSLILGLSKELADWNGQATAG